MKDKINQAQKAWKEQDQSICHLKECGKDVEVHMSVWRYHKNPYDKFNMWMPSDSKAQWNAPAYCLNRPGKHSGWGIGFRPQGVSGSVKRTQKYKNRFLKKCRNQDWGRCSKQCGSGQSIK